MVFNYKINFKCDLQGNLLILIRRYNKSIELAMLESLSNLKIVTQEIKEGGIKLATLLKLLEQGRTINFPELL